MPTVVLFDIDGTLLLTGGAGRRAMEGAFVDVTGRDDACAQLSFAGMTDRAIARHGLVTVGREPTAEAIDALLEAYLVRLAREVPTSQGYAVMPGVLGVLAWLEGVERVAIGLGTGNLELGAKTKLARGELWHRFGFGGFGSDHEDRAELLRIGAARGAQRLGVAVEACRVIVVGDTPKDVAAARAIGATCIAVATGSYSREDLATSGAHHAFATLEDPAARVVLVPR